MRYLQTIHSVAIAVVNIVVLHFLRRLQPESPLRALVQLLLADVSVWIVFASYVHPRFLSSFRNVPRVKGSWPILGYGAVQFLHPRGETFYRWATTIKNQGLLYYPGFFNADQLLLTSPESLSEVLVRRPYAFTKPPAGADLIRKGVGDSLFVAEGDEHRRLRKILQPFFNFRKIQDLYPIFWNKALAFTEVLKERSPKSEKGNEIVAEVLYYADKLTMDTIGLAALGKDMNTLKEPHDLAKAAESVAPTKLGFQLVFIATALFLPTWIMNLFPDAAEKRFDKAGQEMKRICVDFINDRKKDTRDGQKDIFRQIIESNKFRDDELVDNLRMIIATGYKVHDPTAATLAWVLYYLGIHPEWQKRLREEIHANVRQDLFTSNIDAFDAGNVLESLPVLNAVCNEALRFMPTTPVTTRTAGIDTTIFDVFVPKGTKILVPIYAMNRLECFYGSTATIFDPSRWIDADGKANNHGGATSNYAFSTFLHGPRKCIGMAYAKAEIRSFVAAFVARFEFEMKDKTEIPVESGMFSTRPRDGLNLRMKEVDGWWSEDCV